MKTFTTKDLGRRPDAVLDVCDEVGEVRIRRGNGRNYTLRAEDGRPRKIAWRKLVAEHRARIQEIFPEPLSAEQARGVDRMLAGE